MDTSFDLIIARISGLQKGVVAVGQLVAAGVTADAVKVRVARGSLHRLFRGVYLVGHDRPAPEQWRMAAVLAAGEGAALSHHSAAAQYGIGSQLVLPVHVLAAARRRRRRYLVTHETREPFDVVLWRGIPTTTPLRTLQDLSEVLPRERFESALARARVARLLSDEDLHALTQRRSGRSTPIPDEVPPFTRSEQERRLLRRITAAGLGTPGVNEEIEGAERDFVFPEHRIILEVDGPHHDLPHVKRADARRDATAAAAGWTTLRAADAATADLGVLTEDPARP